MTLHIMGDAYAWHVVRYVSREATAPWTVLASCTSIASAQAAMRLLGGAL